MTHVRTTYAVSPPLYNAARDRPASVAVAVSIGHRERCETERRRKVTKLLNATNGLVQIEMQRCQTPYIAALHCGVA